ncbi:MAG: ATP-binding cassette domain-containing protein, partial [Promethearchaeota archaeon]
SKKYHLKGHKKYIKALNNVSFSVQEGETFGILGPNGAGKTTLISLLTTLLIPSSGYAIIDGYNILKDSVKIRSKIALVSGGKMNYNRITGYANLKFFCKIYDIPNYKEKIKKVVKEFELDQWLHEYVERYSSGMKIKLSLCKIFLINPKIIFLDEPTIGLDVTTTNFVINKLKSIDNTIFLASHNMSVVEKLCDRIAFINKGKIEKIGNKEYIKKISHQGINLIIEVERKINNLKEDLKNQFFINSIKELKNGLKITLTDRKFYKDLFFILTNYNITSIREEVPSLEEIFLNEFKN